MHEICPFPLHYIYIYTHKQSKNTSVGFSHFPPKRMEIEADESFKKAGAIPFKWEIRPGVPKLQLSHQQPISPSPDQQYLPLTKLDGTQQVAENNQSRPIPQITPRRLKPPPAADFNFQQPIAEPRTRSKRHVLNLLTRPVTGVASDGCFPSPMLRRATEKNTKISHKTGPEPDYLSDLETVSRWSVSSRKSISPFHDSLSSSFSSRESSPRRPVSDADWVGFALF
ncbi:uncharacterized protein LOC129903250 [Solanum dulcamara]|uniref:uncharacterized protein LOC129903250 n=1 Tax=Solanum dulcamara TaxID=45834 RepID=UPI002486B764|nr:uncharacterized protein LOC129903250 [Solanum dulcamara]